MAIETPQPKTGNSEATEKRNNQHLALIGCEPKDTQIILQLAEAKYDVTCFDTDQARLDNISEPKNPQKSETTKRLGQLIKAGNVTFTNELQEAISSVSVLLVNLPVKTDGKRKVNYHNIRETCRQIGTHMHKGTAIIVLSIMGVGANETEIKETLETASGFRAGTDFSLAYCPSFPLLVQNADIGTGTTCLLAAFDGNSLSNASTILESISKIPIRKTQNMKAAEAATLFSAIERDVNAALAVELASFCEKTGINYIDTAGFIQAKNETAITIPTFTRPQSFLEERLLLENAENASLKLRIPSLAEEVSSDSIKHVVNLVKEGLAGCGKTLKRAKIAVLGAAVKTDPTELSRTILKLAETLDTRGARIRMYDPHLTQDDLSNDHISVKTNLTEALEGVDCAIVTTNQDQFGNLNAKRMRLMMKMPAAIVDLDFVFDPDKIEKEGFTYRGLGRGAA